MTTRRLTRNALLVAIAWTIVVASGCALNRLPRIDPTGRQLLVFPDQPAAGGLAPALPPGGLPAIPPNSVVSPIYTDSLLPGSPGAIASTDAFGRPVIIGAPVASVTGGPIALPTLPGEQIRITPERLLAPVGSEVVLRAGVCATNGYLRTNERIEWMLDRAGTGQIVTVGNRGELDFARMPWNMPRKVDNYFAIGATSPFVQHLDRGTPNPADDIPIRKGDGWITISSPTEGTSYVTAYAPKVENWAGRTARAIIYWVDAQWTFPSPVTLAPGESHTLTTTVTRQTDGAPIAGWIVRYRVAGSGAGLGYDGGQTSEVTTNGQGRASVEITPTDSNSGTSNIAIEIIRPEQSGVASSPRVPLGSGATTITWADGGISGSPLPVIPPAARAPAALPPVDAGPIPPSTATPSPPPAPLARADLFVRIEQLTQGPFRVGDEVEFSVAVVNQGEGIARNVKIVDEFARGLSNSAAAPGEQFIKTDTPFDLASGESQSMPLTFRITESGRLSHSVTVTADNAVSASERAFITVDQAIVAAQPSLQVSIVGVAQQTVGDLTTFRVTVENRGSTAVTNLRITNDRDPELVPKQAYEPYDKPLFQRTGQVQWPVARLDPGRKAIFEIECQCVAAARSTCTRVEVTADGLTVPERAQKCLEIRQPLGGRGLGAAPPVTSPGSGRPLSLTLDATPNPVRLQGRAVVYVLATNNTNQTLVAPNLRVLIPLGLEVDRTHLPSTLSAEPLRRTDGTVLTFSAPDLEPGGKYSLPITVTASQQGNGTLWAEVSASGVASEAISSDIEVIGR